MFSILSPVSGFQPQVRPLVFGSVPSSIPSGRPSTDTVALSGSRDGAATEIRTLRESLRVLQAQVAIDGNVAMPEISYSDLVRHYPSIQDLLDVPYTIFDTPGIIALRKRNLATHHHYWKQNGIMDTGDIQTPERQALRARIVDRLYGQGAPLKNRELFLVVGFPGSGKSTLAHPLAGENGALIVDGDTIRDEIPEYRSTHCSRLVKVERNLVYEALIEKSAANGDNLVLSCLPGPVEIFRQYGTFFKRNDYRLHLVLVDTDGEQLGQRIARRSERTQRLGIGMNLRPDSFTDQARQTYDALKQLKMFDSFQCYDNNGSVPVLVEDGK